MRTTEGGWPLLISIFQFLFSSWVPGDDAGCREPGSLSRHSPLTTALDAYSESLEFITSQTTDITWTKLNSRSFFAGNREDFAKHAVTATISGIIGAIFGWLVGHFLK
jgi:hypothetical protein